MRSGYIMANRESRRKFSSTCFQAPLCYHFSCFFCLHHHHHFLLALPVVGVPLSFIFPVSHPLDSFTTFFAFHYYSTRLPALFLSLSFTLNTALRNVVISFRKLYMLQYLHLTSEKTSRVSNSTRGRESPHTRSFICI